MSYISQFRTQIRRLGIFAVAASTAIVPAQVPTKKPDTEDDKDNSSRPFADAGIIGAEDWKTQGYYHAYSEMDERIHRYQRLEELVSSDAEPGKLFWNQVKFFPSTNGTLSIRGTRSDGMEFIVRRSSIEDGAFDKLCDDLNTKLEVDHEQA